ncbi:MULTISPECIES: PhoH family protein [Desulfofundulus]|uniref:PhoH-like protein n=2 Tax=Desulfofundulus TaxID=2282741 RepID=A0A1M6A8M2_9FIRM|nr:MULTISPECIES: PhoH family protein [Desulfofundulus]AEG16160.1 PhoH family protein [Desulfofundulus kuznetsovii DSM 6115]NHM27339.1 PhoH family protein [Desulfofundulus sp. TPOSR]SHI32800.1 phosphate starvation-inducible protein PhoH [Desulfofundulus thermosubterraneus DSM 16057]
MGEHTEARVILDNIATAAEIFGRHDEHLALMERALGIRVVTRGEEVIIIGPPEQVAQAREVFNQLQDFYRAGNRLTLHEINYAIKAVRAGMQEALSHLAREVTLVTARGKQVKPKTLGQKQYIEAIRKHDIVFAIGPAGTGKTYLAVVMAIRALRNKEVNRLVLTRPAVEAGEKLGFLPGDLQEKVDPYLRPLYDSLYDVLGVENTQKYLERHVIEIAPLAYMRGRTLDDAFIILDEAQNTTDQQMKMFLTRLGFGSKAVITGDITQIDLPRGQVSGLVHAQKVLARVNGIAFCYLTGEDIVRHPLVQEIIRAYEEGS